MKTTLYHIFMLSLGLALLFTATPQIGRSAPSGSPYGTLVDTPAFSIPFVVSTNFLYYSFGINFGIHAEATKGIDLSLGEVEYPPFPPGGGWPAFMTTGGNACLDLRPFLTTAQVDTYKIGVAADSDMYFNVYPIVFSWPDLHSYYSGPVRLKSDLSGSLFDIDMKSTTSFTLTHGPVNFPIPPLVLYIIAQGPLSGTSMPVVSTYGVANGGFQASVNAPAGAAAGARSALSAVAGTTSVWFEYGPTRSYGTSTTPQTVANGTSANVSQPFDPNSLPMDTRIHFRSVAQNNLGTFYGGDRVVSHGNPPPEIVDTSGFVMYRTATYRDWADAKDGKGKRLAFKAKADKAIFTIGVQCKSPGISDLTIEFSSPIDTEEIDTPLSVTPAANDVTGDAKLKKWHIHWLAPLTNGDSVHISGIARSSKAVKVSKYAWGNPAGKGQKDFSSTQTLGLPMPNLHNVGQGIYGGVSQTAVNLIVGLNGDPKGAHTVQHPKYKDVVKSLIKENKGGNLYHTALPHWLDHFDKNNAAISKQQKSLPPDKHNNVLFAEALTLKLNVAASDSGIFPKGLGDLLYTNATPFDGKRIREIIVAVDSFLGRPPVPPEVVTDSSVYLKIVQDINGAFAGPMDTSSWSGGKVICTGVKMLKDIPFLAAAPAATPGTFIGHGPMAGQYGKPGGFRLEQNFPNPFNPTTTISFTLPEEALVTLRVYNLIGQLVATPAEKQEFAGGNNGVAFDGSRLASGVYYYRIEAQDIGNRTIVFSSVKKMLLLK